ncbi:MAG: O-antigen ligase family protein [Kiloniellaceae bacterium]
MRLAAILSAFCFVLPPLSVLASPGVVPLLLITAALAGYAAWRSEGRVPLPDRGLATVLAILLLWSAAASFWGFDVTRSLILTVRIGVLFAAGLVLHAIVRTLDNADRLRIGRWLVAGIVLSLALMAAEVALDFPLLRSIKTEAALGSDPTVLLNRGATAMAMLCWPATAFLWRNGAGRAALALPVIVGVILGFLASLAAISGMVAGAVAATLALGHRKAGRLVLVLATFAALIGSPVAAKIFYALDWQDAQWLPLSAEHRVEIWNFTVERIEERPIFGWGFDAARAMSRLPDAAEASGRSPVALHPHNAPLQILLELGVVGGLIGLGLSLLLIARLQTLPEPNRALAQALFVSTLAIACTAYGLWQNQWLALMISAGLTVALTTGRAAPSGGHN